MGEFIGKTALVTGASAGIGRATARAFARQGARLVLADVDVPAGTALAAEIAAAGGEAIFVRTDVANPEDSAWLLQAAVARFGYVDHAFNNAGITTIADDWDLAAMQRVMAVNLYGVMHGMKYQIAHMLEHGRGGTIVNTASIAGLTGAGTAEYVASKHGVVGLTRSAGIRYASRGVRVNAVCPGVIETAMTAPLMADAPTRGRLDSMVPIGRFGTPDDVAEAVLFLSSPRSGFIVAHALPVDGGYMAR